MIAPRRLSANDTIPVPRPPDPVSLLLDDVMELRASAAMACRYRPRISVEIGVQDGPAVADAVSVAILVEGSVVASGNALSVERSVREARIEFWIWSAKREIENQETAKAEKELV
jgi:hypothetical protein